MRLVGLPGRFVQLGGHGHRAALVSAQRRTHQRLVVDQGLHRRNLCQQTRLALGRFEWRHAISVASNLVRTLAAGIGGQHLFSGGQTGGDVLIGRRLHQTQTIKPGLHQAVGLQTGAFGRVQTVEPFQTGCGLVARMVERERFDRGRRIALRGAGLQLFERRALGPDRSDLGIELLGRALAADAAQFLGIRVQDQIAGQRLDAPAFLERRAFGAVHVHADEDGVAARGVPVGADQHMLRHVVAGVAPRRIEIDDDRDLLLPRLPQGLVDSKVRVFGAGESAAAEGAEQRGDKPVSEHGGTLLFGIQ